MEPEVVKRLRLRWALALLAVAVVALRILAVFSVAGNWDEFSLFESASKTAETGVLHSGGRPGLAQLVVLPLVSGCQDEIEVLRRGRLIWVAFTLLFLVGVGALVAQLQQDREHRLVDALLAIALLALVPAFLEWSIQVRTDQIALTGGVWGGVALLASRRRPALALAAGALFGIGFLSSQKLLYVALLAGLLAFAQLEFGRGVVLRREAIRVGLCALAFAASLLSLHAATVREGVGLAEDHTDQAVLSSTVIRGGLSAFDFYRRTIGWSQYRALLPSLGPHIALAVALAAASIASLRRRRSLDRALILAWLVLAAGAFVGVFHGARFFYFWMTLGLFPAVAFAVARRSICGLLPDRRRESALLIGAFWLALAGPGLVRMIDLLTDTQRIQRESFEFIHHNFREQDAGFSPESALFCRGEGQPLKNYFSRDIHRNFGVPGSEPNRERLISRFRGQPILFLLESFRLNQFPVEVRRFWVEHYQPYRASVFVLGRRLEGGAGSHSAFELIAPGDYRWLPAAGSASVAVDGRPLAPGEVVRLGSGGHVADFEEDGTGGMLVLALADPPDVAPLPFYKGY